MSIEKCKDFIKDGFGTWDDSPKPTTLANLHDFMKNQNNIVLNLSTMLWQPSTEYKAGKIVYSKDLPDGCVVRCTKAGTTGATEPRWTAAGSTVTDGTAEWTIENSNAKFEDLHQKIKAETKEETDNLKKSLAETKEETDNLKKSLADTLGSRYLERNTSYKAGDILRAKGLPSYILVEIVKDGTTGPVQPDLKDKMGGGNT